MRSSAGGTIRWVHQWGRVSVGRAGRLVVIVAVVLGASLAAAPAGAALAGGNGPSVTAIWPRSGPVGGGTSVTVAGSGFAAATAVTVDGVAVARVHRCVRQRGPGDRSAVSHRWTGSRAQCRSRRRPVRAPRLPLNTFAYRTGGTSIMVPSYIYPGSALVEDRRRSPARRPGDHQPGERARYLGRSELRVAGGHFARLRRRCRRLRAHVVRVPIAEHRREGDRRVRELVPRRRNLRRRGVDQLLDGGVVLRAAVLVHPRATGARPHDPESRRGDQSVLHGGGRRRARIRGHRRPISLRQDHSRRGPPATPAGRFWGVVYHASGVASCRRCCATLAADGFGEVYVTDQNLPNPYGALPSYWSQELTAARRAPVSRLATPPRSPSGDVHDDATGFGPWAAGTS